MEHHVSAFPRLRYTQYCEDLYRFHEKSIDQETYLYGGQYSLSKIGDEMMQHCREWFHNLEMLVTASWSYDFDPDHTHCGPYLAERYHLHSDLFDVCNQGTLPVFTAVHLLQRYLENKIYKKGMILALEQTTIPRNIKDHDVIPKYDGGGALLIEYLDNLKRQSKHSIIFKLLNCWIFDTSVLHLNKTTGLDNILKLIKPFIKQNNVLFVTKKTNLIWKQLKTNIIQKKHNFLFYQFDHFSYEPSILTPLIYLDKFVQSYQHTDSNNPSLIILVDEDIESLNVGVILLEVLY